MPPSKSRIYLPAAIVVVLAAWALIRSSPRTAIAEEGLPAPALSLVDITGQTAALSHYRGKVVLLDFWATWCDSCREDIPSLKRIHALFHPQGLELLAAAVDDGPKTLIPFAAQNQIPWRVLIADPAGARQYGVSGLPTKYLIDREGIISRKYSGNVAPQAVERDIQALIDKRRPR